MFAAYVPTASTSGLAAASTYTAVFGVTTKLSLRESWIDAGFGTTAYASGADAGAGEVTGPRQALTPNTATLAATIFRIVIVVIGILIAGQLQPESHLACICNYTTSTL
jgi:hypothetical protein